MAYTPKNPNGQATKANSAPVVLASDQDALQNVGNVANGVADAGNPVKVGGKAQTSTPATVSDGQRVDSSFDKHGRQNVSQYSPELNNSVANTSLRDIQVAQRYTLIGDSFVDGLASIWTSTNSGGASAPAVSGGEGVIDTGANATGVAQLTSVPLVYLPGQSHWFNSSLRFSDTGSAGNTRRVGPFTVSGTTPQDGFYFELTSSGIAAVSCKAGTPTSVAVGSWSRFAFDPFTLTTDYLSLEVRYTANSAQFYVNNILRHIVSGTSSGLTNSLNFPITLSSINTSGATSRAIYMRNVGLGRFGTQPRLRDYSGTPPKFATISASSSGNNTIVAAVTGKKIKVLRMTLTANGAVNAKFQSGAGGTDITGLHYLAANGGWVEPFCQEGLFETTAGSLLNLNLSGAVAVGGSLTYLEV